MSTRPGKPIKVIATEAAKKTAAFAKNAHKAMEAAQAAAKSGDPVTARFESGVANLAATDARNEASAASKVLERPEMFAISAKNPEAAKEIRSIVEAALESAEQAEADAADATVATDLQI